MKNLLGVQAELHGAWCDFRHEEHVENAFNVWIEGHLATLRKDRSEVLIKELSSVEVRGALRYAFYSGSQWRGSQSA